MQLLLSQDFRIWIAACLFKTLKSTLKFNLYSYDDIISTFIAGFHSPALEDAIFRWSRVLGIRSKYTKISTCVAGSWEDFINVFSVRE